MRRETSLFLTLSLFSTIVPPIFAQDLPGRPDPVPPPPTNVIGPQLIVWSEMQKPQPIPEPVREPGRESKESRQPDEGAASTPSDQKSAHEGPSPAINPAQEN
jgi:hypothetical protein